MRPLCNPASALSSWQILILTKDYVGERENKEESHAGCRIMRREHFVPSLSLLALIPFFMLISEDRSEEWKRTKVRRNGGMSWKRSESTYRQVYSGGRFDVDLQLRD